MGTLLQDVKYGLRMLVKSPGFTTVAVIALALGIGANSAVFSSVNAMLLRPFAFQQLDRVVAVWETVPAQGIRHASAAPANFRDLTEQCRTLELLSAIHGWDSNLTGEGIADRLEGARVTPNFFPLAGSTPQLGRALTADDFKPGQGAVLILSHGFWQRRLGGDPNVIGRNLLLDGQKTTVIGIMPSEFDYPVGMDAWAPLDLSAAQDDRANHYLHVIGRLKPGVSQAQAQAELETIAAGLGAQNPATNAGHGLRVVGLVEDLLEGSREFLIVLTGAAVFVLLLACANVANLQLARILARQKEIATRLALGANRWQIIRQLLIESVLVAVLGGCAGVLLADWGIDAMRRAIPPFILQHIAGLKHMGVNPEVVALTLAVALLAGILSGLVPAWFVSRSNLQLALQRGERGTSTISGHRSLRSALVVLEVALAGILLVGAVEMVKGFRVLLNRYPGYDRARVLTFRMHIPETQHRNSTGARDHYDRVIQALEALPGVEAAGPVSNLPSGWGWNRTLYRGEGQPPARPGEMRRAVSQLVGPGFFSALRLPLLSGRVLTAQDGPEAPPVAVISQSLSRAVWPGENPVGKHIKLGEESGQEPWRAVVGVVGDIRSDPFDEEWHPTVYMPFAQMPQTSSAVVIRTSGDPLALAPAVRDAVQSVDPNVPAFELRTLEQLISDNVSGVDSAARLMSAFGAIALALAAAGIFALMSYSVRQQTHDIGVRMALGARSPSVLWMVLGHALKLTFVGLVIGLAGAVGVMRIMSSLLSGIVRLDALTTLGVAGVLTLASVIAAYLPAWRATKVDPMAALRYE
ncbi:MAG: ABC transporter permease [Terriglobia bacterium]